jgi:hypothetical protein
MGFGVRVDGPVGRFVGVFHRVIGTGSTQADETRRFGNVHLWASGKYNIDPDEAKEKSLFAVVGL